MQEIILQNMANLGTFIVPQVLEYFYPKYNSMPRCHCKAVLSFKPKCYSKLFSFARKTTLG